MWEMSPRRGAMGGVWTGVHIIIERVKSCEVPYYLSILPRVASRCSLHIRAL
jgi:hypothetical protein